MMYDIRRSCEVGVAVGHYRNCFDVLGVVVGIVQFWNIVYTLISHLL